MDEIQRMYIEHACTRLCMEFHRYIDTYAHEKVVNLFAEDGIWYHKTGEFRGRAAMRQYLDAKSTYPVVRHFLSTHLIDVLSAEHAKGVIYGALFYGEPVPNGAPPVALPPVVFQYNDEFKLTPEGWRFASRRPEFPFVGADLATIIQTKADEERRRGKTG